MDTETYQGRIRARRAEWAARSGSRRFHLADKARHRSARRWADETSRLEQERRAGRLRLVIGDGEERVEAG